MKDWHYVLIGIGALLLLGAKKAVAAISPDSGKAEPHPPAPTPPTGGPAPTASALLNARARSLENRAATGAGWLKDIHDLPTGLGAKVEAAITRWIGIESGGNPLVQSKTGKERGLCAIHVDEMNAGAITKIEWDALLSPATSRREQARIAVKYVVWHINRAPGTWRADDIDAIFWAKLHHALPLYVKELTDQKLLGENHDGIYGRMLDLKPSLQLASYALNPPGGAQGLAIRFLVPANVVAEGVGV